MDVVAETEDSDLAPLWATATGRVSDEPFPGVVQVEFHEEDGTKVVIREKAAVIDAARCTPAAHYPRSVVLKCRILAATTRTYDVELAHHVEDLHGRSRFTVHYENVDLCRYDELEFED